MHILDFFHATEHLTEAGHAMHKEGANRKKWLEQACHDLKHQRNGAKHILRELHEHSKTLKAPIPENLLATITCFENNLERMNYAKYQKAGYPIGSGVTEAACKVVAKQRLSASGMRWNIDPAQHTFLLRGIICTDGRWEQFWNQFDKNGV